MKDNYQEKNQLDIIWAKVKDILQGTVSPITFKTYICLLEPVDFEGARMFLQIAGKNAGYYIGLNLAGKIKEAFLQAKVGVAEYTIREAGTGEILYESGETEDVEQEYGSLPIDSKFTFESYVVGNNELVFAAAKSVAAMPGENYNPLYIWGPTGLGKTHLMQAIANEIMRTKPTLRVVYTTCEKFMNQLIDLIANKSNSREKGQRFRAFYRTADVLIIDDIQFLEKKQATQEEIFHTFNELTASKKQIILSSDCPPKDINTLEARLRTRFESGLIADIQPPNIETKIAILKRKALEKKCPIPTNDVLEYLAQDSDNNVRTLEGRLNKVIFASKLHECPITVELARTALRTSVQEDETYNTAVNSDSVIAGVCTFFKIKKEELIGKSKKKELVYPRQITAYLMYEMLSMPFASIGKEMGGRDHTTIMYSRNKIAESMEKNERIKKDVNDIKNIILKK